MPADASVLMQQGIALLGQNTQASLTEAIGLFDEAIVMRRTLLVPGDHWMAYLTAASWMNRGDALTRLAQPTQLAEALRSYDEALAVMGELPLDANPLYRRRQAIAWMNRGITLHEQGTAASFAAAVKSFDDGIERVRGYPEHSLLLACAWMNRANSLRTDPPRAAEARVSAVTALGLVTGSEQQDLIAAETGLKARYIVCQAIAVQLSGDPVAGLPLDLVSAATDALEEGLGLARPWEAKGETRFRPVLANLFRFGVSVYQAYQPHFLTEFILENLDPKQPQAGFSENAEMHTVAADALSAVARNLHHEGFASLNPSRLDRLLEALRALRFTEERLRVLTH